MGGLRRGVAREGAAHQGPGLRIPGRDQRVQQTPDHACAYLPQHRQHADYLGDPPGGDRDYCRGFPELSGVGVPPPNPAWGLVGESACGKTITCLSILHLAPQPAGHTIGGEILLNGEDLLKKSENEMRHIRGSQISMILQDPMTSLNPVFTIGNQVAWPIRLHQNLKGNRIWERVREMLTLVKIPSPEVRMRENHHQQAYPVARKNYQRKHPVRGQGHRPTGKNCAQGLTGQASGRFSGPLQLTQPEAAGRKNHRRTDSGKRRHAEKRNPGQGRRSPRSGGASAGPGQSTPP